MIQQKIIGITSSQFNKRLKRAWTLEEALEIPILPANCGGQPRIAYEYYGNYYPIKTIAKMNNIREGTLRKRLSIGWSIYEAAEIPTKIVKRGD